MNEDLIAYPIAILIFLAGVYLLFLAPVNERFEEICREHNGKLETQFIFGNKCTITGGIIIKNGSYMND